MEKSCFIFRLVSVCWDQVEDILHLKTRGTREEKIRTFNKPATCPEDTECKVGHFRVPLNKLVYYMISKQICATS